MYFYLKSGKTHIDLGSDLILTLDHNIVVTQLKRCAPAGVHNATYILLRKLSLWGKIRACGKVCKFILFRRPIR